MSAGTADTAIARWRRTLRRADEPARDGDLDSAVLIPFRRTGDDLEVVLTVRPDHLPAHPGQIAFPGGHLGVGEHPRDAALRETEEEVGVPPKAIQVLGHMDDHLGPAWKTVRSFVGIIDANAPLVPDPGEVEAVFTLPVKAFMEPDVYKPRMLAPDADQGWGGYLVNVFDVEPRPVWGFTAGLLVEALDAGFGWTPSKPPRVVQTVEALRDGLP